MKKILFGTLAAAGVSLIAVSALAHGDRGEKRFDRLDANNDGEITASEIAAAEARADERREDRAGRRAERRAKMLEEADTDNSGTVSREEMDAFRAAKRAERNPDKNGDGVVSEVEFLEKARERFDRMDKDDDGVLSEDELRKGKRHGKHRGHG